jgi:CRISPR-associated protein Cas5t
MKYCIVEITAQTASYRNPEFQNFHKSLLLPPPTTLIGLAGAALGLSPRAVQAYFDADKFSLGVYGTSQGIARDLWKYNTFDGQGSVIIKEILFDNYCILVYGCENEIKIQELQNAFLHPHYALTLGNNDSLAKVTEVQIIQEQSTSDRVEHCLVAGNIINEVLENAANGLDFSIYTSSDPITYDMPVRFVYESDYGFRKVVARKALSVIGEAMQLNILKQGVYYKNKFVPIFELS